MIAFLIALTPYIPAALSLAGFLINLFGTSKENLEAYKTMIQKNKDAGLITVDTFNKLNDFHDEMLKELEEKKNQEQKKKEESNENTK